MFGFFIYVLILIIGAFLLPEIYFDTYSERLIYVIGPVAVWRYSWVMLSFFRAMFYRKIVFKKIRQEANALSDESKPDHVFLLITTFRVGTSVSAVVYREAFKEAINSKMDVTIIASIVEMSEENLIRASFQQQKPPSNVKLVITRVKGSGKRDGLAVGFRVVANSKVDKARSVVAVIDGDSILSEGLIDKCVRLFALNPKLGALTTDEDALLEGEDNITEIYRQWYRMRFAQRHLTMSSLSLSNRVLTLTGRMSMFRANILGDKGFIDTVQSDYISHWRLGTFDFLTGDDKSSWYHLMKEGWDTWYVPDVVVYTVEEIPDRNYFKGATTLMLRWFGNSLRTNSRALKIPRKTLGWFAWWSLYDQRTTMWTSIYGFLVGIFASIMWGPTIMFAYLWWIMFTRLLQAGILLSSRDKILVSWPFFLYFNQIYGSLVKIYIYNHLYKQSWTRQKTKAKEGERWDQWYRKSSSDAMLSFELLIFSVLVMFLVGLLTADDLYKWLHAIATIFN